MPDWDDLRVFLAVVRAESLSAAGKALRLDPATVGRRIVKLEEALGTRLFVKGPQGYAATEAGLRLLPHAEAAEQALQAAADDLRGSGGAGGLSGQVRIGAPDGCANYLLPRIVAAICDDNPGLEVQIVALPRVINLSRREADMVIAVSPPTAGRLTVQRLTDYHLHLAASRAYLDRHGTPQRRADLTGHRIVGYIPDMIFDKELDYLAEIGVSPFAPELVKVLPAEVSLTRAFWLIRHADDRRTSRMNRFADLLTQGLRREVLRMEAMA